MVKEIPLETIQIVILLLAFEKVESGMDLDDIHTRFGLAEESFG